MDNHDQPMTADQELQYIRKVIAESRMSFVEDGMPYIWWGLIVAVGMGVTYLSVVTQRELYVGYVWLALILSGWGTIIYYMRAKRFRVKHAHSFVDRIQGSIWGACGAALGLGVLLIVTVGHGDPNTPSIHPFYACFVSALILGIAYFLSGVVNDLKWLRNVGFAWWLGAIAMFAWPTVHVLAIYAGMLIVFQVIPGIVLQRRYRRIVSSGVQEA